MSDTVLGADFMQAHIIRRSMFVVAVAALLLSLMTGVRAQGVNVTGDWAFDVQTGMGAGSPAISFKQDGEALTGTYSGTVGNANFKGTIKGNVIDFAFEVDAQGQTIDVHYKGTVDKDTMKGDVAMAGGQLSGTFTAKRK
jgi:hypothetical protein